MSSELPVFTVGPGPHWRASSSIAQTNYAYLLALLPAAVVGVVAYSFGPAAPAELPPATNLFQEFVRIALRELGVHAGALSLIGAAGVVLLAMGVGIFAEYAIQVIFRQPYRATDGHGALMGLIIAMLMPPSVPWWVLVFGVVVTVLIGKQIFGGLGGYPFHPAIVGWLILLLSWPNHIYPVGMDSIAAQADAAIIVTFAGGLALVALGHVRMSVPLGVIIGVAVSALIFQQAYPETVAGPFAQITTGHVILAAFFISPDPSSSPSNAVPSWIYAIGTGVLIMLIRVYGIWADAVPFAVLLMNVLNPLLDRIRPRVKEVVIQHG